MTTAAVARHRSVTAEEFLRMPADGDRHELVNGVVTTVAPAGYEHGRVTGRLSTALATFVEAQDAGEVLAAETGFTIGREPDTVRAPDVAFVRQDRVPPEDAQDGFAELAPDLVVEVVSPWDRAVEVNTKALQWIDAGVRLVWVVDPGSRLVIVHDAAGPPSILREDSVLDGGDVLPGFTLPVERVFTRRRREA